MHFQAFLWLYVFVTDIWVSQSNKGNVAWKGESWSDSADLIHKEKGGTE